MASGLRQVLAWQPRPDEPSPESLQTNGAGGIRTAIEKPKEFELLGDGAALDPTDPELMQVVRSWPDLPDPIKLAILALVRSRLAK